MASTPSRASYLGCEIREIPGFYGRYSASSDGRVWSHISDKFLLPALRRDGYLYVALRLHGRCVQDAVHRLVAKAFHGMPVLGMQVNHLNLVKTDNAPLNLEWCTPGENSRHARRTLPPEKLASMREGRRAGRLKCNRGKRTLTPEQVSKARSLLHFGLSQQKTARIVGTSRNTIFRLAKGATYRD